ALNANTTANSNSAFGYQALAANTTGPWNTAVGYQALAANTTGDSNSALGLAALGQNTTGLENSAFGASALFYNTTGTGNSSFGGSALVFNSTGSSNSAFGDSALHDNSTGYDNSAFGVQALYHTTGNGNVAVGVQAGHSQTTGSYNIYLDNAGVAGESNTIHIGTNGRHAATYIAGISGATSASGSAVYVNSSGQLGTATSSRRYKEEIADMAGQSDVLMKLRPVSFYYKPELDASHTRQYGLVAEEVAEVAPELVLNDESGTPQTVRYHFVNALLLNEVQKQRRQLEAQEAEIRELRVQQAQVQELKEQLARLEARLEQ
ncbi:MAG TPA: tail fiber domain-containing protein, partial [Vicinamibacteria bacterium]|nr:tail fiber domain-containing protein [Vicinamibacteria bacterium]